jgi:hypothetical protein
MVLDFVLNLVPGGVTRDNLSDDLLGAVSLKQVWLSHFYAWIRKIISTPDAWMRAPLLAKQVRVLMYSIVSIRRLRDHTPAIFIKMAVSCALLNPLVRKRTSLLFSVGRDSSRREKQKQRSRPQDHTLEAQHLQTPCARAHGQPHAKRGACEQGVTRAKSGR